MAEEVQDEAAEETAEKMEAVVQVLTSEKLGAVDKILGRIISRKFFVFLTATGLLTWANLDSDTWGMIAMIYIGGQTVIDAAVAWKHGPR
tara:strand:- start:24 stop:293 length:270 start_codon:yes stop_codon:yes gene_type:complete